RQLLIGISTMRYFPPSGTAGLARSFVNGNKRVPAPPPIMMASVPCVVPGGSAGVDIVDKSRRESFLSTGPITQCPRLWANVLRICPISVVGKRDERGISRRPLRRSASTLICKITAPFLIFKRQKRLTEATRQRRHDKNALCKMGRLEKQSGWLAVEHRR